MCDTHALGLGFTRYEVVRTIFCPYTVEIKHVCSCYEQPHLKVQLKLAFGMRWKMYSDYRPSLRKDVHSGVLGFSHETRQKWSKIELERDVEDV